MKQTRKVPRQRRAPVCARCGKRVDKVKDLCAGCGWYVCVGCAADGHHWGFDTQGNHVLKGKR